MKQVMHNSCLISLQLVFCLLLLIGCGHNDEKASAPTDEGTQYSNEYTQQSVFEVILRKAQAEPDNPVALYHLADFYDRNGRYAKAVETFQKVIELDPDKGYAYFKMGTGYSRMNQPAKAVEVLKEATEHLPNNPLVWNNLGIAYGKLGQLDQEVLAMRKALEIRPRYASARFNLALTLQKKGDLDGAFAQYDELLKTDKTMAKVLKKRLDALQK